MSQTTPQLELNSVQDAEASNVYERLRGIFDEELKQMARWMASKSDSQLLGETEFELRDRVHAMGAQVLEAAADERQKRG